MAVKAEKCVIKIKKSKTYENFAIAGSSRCVFAGCDLTIQGVGDGHPILD
jgi:hypothetical protein